MNETILDKKIKLWEDQLLDLGKRNKMISFRETKRATLKILKPGFEDLYQRIVVDEQELTFQKAIDRDSDIRVYSILSLLDKLSSPIEVSVGDIRGEGSLPEIKKTLKHLRSKARLAMDEQGTNILYLVFGFVEWHEKGSRNDNWIKSPLILVPVSLVLPSLDAQYSLKKHEDEIVVNPTLAYLFNRDYGIDLPEFDSDKDTLESFMQKMESLVDERGWRIVRECSIGLVSFLKISMYNDLIRNEEQLKTNPIIRAFAGEQNQVNSLPRELNEFDHDSCKAVDSYQVLDADSSQQDAIELSQRGASFVMQGPPGTGKSQTITNIIAQGLADGKKILFVSEKMVALDVVYRRLTDVQLDDFCLSLHSHKANKKEILAQLGNNLNLQRIKVKDEETAKLTRLDMLKEQLKAYVKDIHTTIMPLEMSLYEVYGAILELGNLPDIALQLSNAEELTKDQVNRLALLVMNLDKAQGVLGPQWYKNPWQGITGTYLEVSQKRELQDKLHEALRVLSALEECRLIEKTIADILTIDTLDAFWALYEHAQHCSKIPNDWFSRTTEHEEKLVQALFEKKNCIDGLNKALAEKYDRDFFGLDGTKLHSQFTNAIDNCQSKLRHLSFDEDAFNQLESDYDQLQQLNEMIQLLVDAFNVLSEKYNLHLPCENDSVEAIFTICGMLLEKRNLTGAYFGADNIKDLKKYASNVRNTFALMESHKQHLCEKYAAAILDIPNVEQCLSQLDSALETFEDLPFGSDLDYAVVESISAIDMDRIQRIDDIWSDPIMERISIKHGVEFPNTLAMVHCQIAAIESLPTAMTVPCWQSPKERQNASHLLWAVINHNSKLHDAKAQIEEFFKESGITLNIDLFTSEDLKELYQAHKVIPEAALVVENCNNDEAYNLLSMIAQNATAWSSVCQQVSEFRKEHHIANTIDNTQLLTALQERRPNAELCAPSLQWAEARENVYALLEQLTTLANKLQDQHNQLTAVYEDSVFLLDYSAMLNRFKAEYTSFFKIFKSAYKEDVKQVRLVFKEVRKKVADEEIISLLQFLRQYNEDLEKYNSFSKQVSLLLDVQEYNIWYDWESVKKRLDAFVGLSSIFDGAKNTHRFIIEAPWDHIIALLNQYVELDKWFADNEKAKSLYGNLYKRHDTDTEYIQELLNHAKSMCKLFASPKYYLNFMDDAFAQRFQRGTEQASIMLETREWFAYKQKEIENFTSITYDETTDPWRDILTKLEVYEDIVSAFGEQATYSLVTKYSEDKELIASYVSALQTIASIEECAKIVYNVDSISNEDSNLQISILTENIREIISSANEIKSVYSTVSDYCPATYSTLSVAALEHDLEEIQFYQDTVSSLTTINEKSQAVLGKDYNGLDTDWDAVEANIRFCEKVNTLLSGNVPSELAMAFVDATSIYSESQLSELWQYFASAKEIESTYSGISCIKGLNQKSGVLSDVLGSMESAISIKNAVARNAFVPCTYNSFTDALHKLSAMQTAQKAYTEELSRAQALMPTFELSGDTDWAYTIEVFGHMKQIKRIVSLGNVDTEVAKWLTNGIKGLSSSSYYAEIEKLIRYRSDFTDITSMFSNKATLENYSLQKLGRRFKNCDDLFATMDAWIDLRDCKTACQDNGLSDFVLQAEDAYYPEGTLKDVFLKSFYYEWFEKVCANIESVANFRVRTQSARVEAFRDLDAHQLPVNQMRIRERLIQEMPSKHNFGRATDEMSVLLHELGKKRNIMPLRKLFRTIPNLLLRLKPCLMMSPLSVSYFLRLRLINLTWLSLTRHLRFSRRMQSGRFSVVHKLLLLAIVSSFLLQISSLPAQITMLISISTRKTRRILFSIRFWKRQPTVCRIAHCCGTIVAGVRI